MAAYPRSRPRRLHTLLSLVLVGMALLVVDVPAEAATKTIALTFDDGPHARYTPMVLDILKRHGVKATFCVVGNRVAEYPALTRRIRTEGHRLCNHSRTHVRMTSLSSPAVREQIRTTQREIRTATGVTPTLFRFPYDDSSARVVTIVHGEDLRIAGWTIDPKDWDEPPAPTITSRVLASARSGAVVLLHDGGGDQSATVRALDPLIRQLKARGYTFVQL
jgi:peptidoglycan-N-acetylglucosamine deacetylase